MGRLLKILKISFPPWCIFSKTFLSTFVQLKLNYLITCMPHYISKSSNPLFSHVRDAILCSFINYCRRYRFKCCPPLFSFKRYLIQQLHVYIILVKRQAERSKWMNVICAEVWYAYSSPGMANMVSIFLYFMYFLWTALYFYCLIVCWY